MLFNSNRGCVPKPVAPVAYQATLEPGIGQFREFEPRRVHTRKKLVGIFSCAQIDLRKAREQHSMENRRAVGLLNPMRDKKRKQEPGGRRDDTCDHCLSRSWKVKVWGKEKKQKTERSLIFVWWFLVRFCSFFYCMPAGLHSDSTPDSRQACSSVLMITVRFVRCRGHSRQQPLVVCSRELVSCGDGGLLKPMRL